MNPGSFANEFEPIDFVSRDIHSFLRNETIARVLYLCKDVETFGSGIRKIYSLCNAAGVEIKYENADTDFKIEFSRIDRNKSPLSGQENGRINDHISDLEQAVLSCLRDDPRMTNAELVVKTGKSQRIITRVLAFLKGKGLINRIGSNKTGCRIWFTGFVQKRMEISVLNQTGIVDLVRGGIKHRIARPEI